ncbi:alanine racemase [Fructilactobacillus fructivorans]|uniref:Alanine racemase n=1 Tax=Fructilactobacillus fructivorans TaxID=1614 RepID=A0AAE6TWW9_9LACO|nr:alanine racemase [Fructilactobacillus fructivorans]KRK57373.1 alanine racemase [Fructilactobacillus fructivorans]KRN41024.1 alanine racemase [Fructilactobacillus fructivorans]KRN42990.1 alanine racemase [Fructilactobacillus fructivorans]QFX93057.1 alanine racemase [Fructilactobacillus fructivorans]RDV64676.1 alanine racemase [Fructilactobacillus fructivorans]
MAVGKNRNAQLVIDEDAIFHNISEERKRLDSKSDLFMVVKANAYGHGAVQVAGIAKAAGATGFCVAILDEAIQLREAGFVSEPILVLGLSDLSNVPLISKYNVSVTVSSVDWIKQAAELAQKLGLKNKIRVHLALDTGMGRIGLQTVSEVKDAIVELKRTSEYIDFEGVFTHFSTADSTDDDYFQYQLDNFNELMTAIPEKPRYVHVANSATSMWHKAAGGNMVRFGVAGYGLNPSGVAIASPFKLEPAMSFTSELIYVKEVQSGRSIGYGATYTSDSREWIGTVPVGYADGVRRSMQGFSVLVDGQYCPIVGRVCMDQLMVRLPYKMPIGTKVTLVGTDHDHTITLQDVADYCHTIHYEIACGYSSRLPRVYRSSDHLK